MNSIFDQSLLASTLPQGYKFRGVTAPQVQPRALPAELNQKLQALRTRLRSRAVSTSLATAVEQSLLNNPELEQAYTQIQQNQWNLIAVRRQWYPSLSVAAIGPAGGLWGAAGNRLLTSSSEAGRSLTTNSSEYRSQFAPNISLNWTFFDPSRSPQINAANEDLRSQELLFNVSARNLVLQTQLAYFNLQEQEQLLNAYEQILNATTDQVNQVEALFNAGDASIADVEQIRTQQYQTYTLLISSYLGLIDAAAALARAMALPPGNLVLPEDSIESYGNWDKSLQVTIQEAQELREEIQSSLAQAKSAKWRASSLFNRYWPRFALTANGSFLDENLNLSSSGTINTQKRQTTTWYGAIGIGFNWSFFDGGVAAAQAEADKSLARQLTAQAASQRLLVSEEVEKSFASYEASLLALLSTREQLDSAQKAAAAIRERFSVGFSDTTSVVQILNQVITAANAYSRSQREYNSAVASLYRASAQWPNNTQGLLQLRVDALKNK